MKAGYIYIVSDPDSAIRDKYKVGITTREKSKLINDYRRSRPEIQCFFFKKISNPKLVETKVLEYFDDKRILHESGKKSEWIRCDIETIVKIIDRHINLRTPEHTGNQKINNIKQMVILFFINNYNITGNSKDRIAATEIYSKYDKLSSTIKINYQVFCKYILGYISQMTNRSKKNCKIKIKGKIYYTQISEKLVVSKGWCAIL